MATVTQVAKKVKQPRGGYINPRDFQVTELNSSNDLHDEENIHAILIGMAVDYLSRFMIGADVKEAFKYSLKGAANVNELAKANDIINAIQDLDSASIANACKMVGYDVAYRGVSMKWWTQRV